jgi:F0F1-type ATP synthase assembly protein I
MSDTDAILSKVYGVGTALAILAGIIMIFWVWSLMAPVTTELIDDTSGIILNQARNTSDGNLSNAANLAITPLRNTVANFEWITYAVLFGCFCGFFVFCFAVRAYPFLIVFWIIGMVLLTLMSIWLSSAYENVTSGSDYFTTATTSWATSHYILSNLPIFMISITLLGGIILFVIVSRDTEAAVQAL